MVFGQWLKMRMQVGYKILPWNVKHTVLFYGGAQKKF